MLDICFWLSMLLATMGSMMRGVEWDRQFQHFPLLLLRLFMFQNSLTLSLDSVLSTDWKAILHNKNDWKNYMKDDFDDVFCWARERESEWDDKSKSEIFLKAEKKQAIWLL